MTYPASGPSSPATNARLGGAGTPTTAPRELFRFSLLAHAVAGRRITVIGNDVPRAFTDGETVTVPTRRPYEFLRDGVAVQAALLAAGSLEPTVLTRLTGRRALRLRYLTLEATRAAQMLPPCTRGRLRDFYDGPAPKSARDSLARALNGRDSVPEAPEWMGTVKPLLTLRTNPAASTPTSAEQTASALLQETPELDDEDESERSRILELFASPLTNPLMEMLQKTLGSGRGASSDDGAGQDMPVGGTRHAPVGKRATAVPGLPVDAPFGGLPIGYRYPEWDHHRRTYRPEWCSVTEYDPPPPAHAEVSVPATDRALRRQLARLGLTHQRHRRQVSGDDLDITALVELVVDRAAGHGGDSRVYETNRRTAHDLGVLVLLDTSGSTAEAASDRPVFEHQREVTGRLTATLEALGDRVAAYGFCSHGRHGVRFLRVKDFDDRFDHSAQQRLTTLDPTGYTRLGAAVRHGTQLLTTRAGTSRLLLVVIGDGFPYDDDGYTSRHAQEDSHQALREAVAQGVGCVCLNIGMTTDPDVICRVWGEMPHSALNDPDQLPDQVFGLFGEAIRKAEASRRSAGHPHHIPAGLPTRRST